MTSLTHYILEGEAGGCWPSLYFDPPWYRATYGIAAGDSPLAHYLAHRRGQKFSPLPIFDVEFYVRAYSDSVRVGRDAFMHYLSFGAARDFNPAPWFHASTYRHERMSRRAGVDKAAVENTKDWRLEEMEQTPLLHLLATILPGQHQNLLLHSLTTSPRQEQQPSGATRSQSWRPAMKDSTTTLSCQNGTAVFVPAGARRRPPPVQDTSGSAGQPRPKPP
jgi:hypothetical protein